MVQQTAQASSVLDHRIAELAYAMKVFRMSSGIERARDLVATAEVAGDEPPLQRAVA